MGEEEEERSSSTNYNHVWFYRTNKNPNNNVELGMKELEVCYFEVQSRLNIQKCVVL